MKMLDKVFSNKEWLSQYPYTSLFCYPIAASDHGPIMFDTNKTHSYKKHIFRFQNVWLLDPNCEQIILKAWNQPRRGSLAFQLVEKLKETKKALIDWDKETFAKLNNQIKELESKLVELQDVQWTMVQ